MLELNNQLFCQIGELSNDGFFVYNTTTGKFLYHNKSVLAIVELPELELLQGDVSVLKIVHPEDREHAIFCYEECVTDQAAKKYELRLLFVGREKFLRLSLFPLTQNDEHLICGIVEDITIEKHNKIYIEQINAHKNITLEVLSHDLKEPLGMMRLTASSIENEVAVSESSKIKDALSFIKEMCERNMKLVRSMVNREFVKSSVIELRKERTELVWELQDLLRFYRRSHLRELKDFRFTSSHEKIFVPLDPMKFMQVINNLISNAIKFTTYGGWIELGVENREKSVVVTVADNGVGIPDGLKPILFERGENSLKLGLSGENSGGLGMNIIKTIVELHEGVIWFESEEGRGSKFYIELPK